MSGALISDDGLRRCRYKPAPKRNKHKRTLDIMKNGKNVYVIPCLVGVDTGYVDTSYLVFCNQTEAEEVRLQLLAGEFRTVNARSVGEVFTVKEISDEAEIIASSLSRITEGWVRESFWLCICSVLICIEVFIPQSNEGLDILVYLAGIALGYSLFLLQKTLIIRGVKKDLSPTRYVDDITYNAERAFSIKGNHNERQ